MDGVQLPFRQQRTYDDLQLIEVLSPSLHPFTLLIYQANSYFINLDIMTEKDLLSGHSSSSKGRGSLALL